MMYIEISLMQILEEAKKDIAETKNVFFQQTITLINGAFAFVAALAWNEAIKALLDKYVQAGSELYSRFLYALVVTVIVVIITSRLSKIAARRGIDAHGQE
jgi:hypothetical protein